MKSSPVDRPQTRPSKISRRLLASSVFGWITTPFRRLLELAGSAWTSPAMRGQKLSQIEKLASATPTPEPPPSSTHDVEKSISEEAKPDRVTTIDAQASSPHSRPTTAPNNSLSPGLGDNVLNSQPPLESNTFRTQPTGRSPMGPAQPGAGVSVQMHQSELPRTMGSLQQTLSEQSRNSVTRAELKRELDTLRRLIESRK
jgi:hypothetical protein